MKTGGKKESRGRKCRQGKGAQKEEESGGRGKGVGVREKIINGGGAGTKHDEKEDWELAGGKGHG